MMATLTRRFLFTVILFVLGGHFCFGITVSVLPHNPCYNSCNGSIGASASGGTAPYQYSWNSGVTWYTSGLYYGLCPGTYTVIARDAVNATDTATVTLLAVGPLTFTATPTNCSSWSTCDGQITFSVSGGTPPYTYIVTNPSNVTTNYTTNPVTNLCVGTYTVTVHDANGCGSNSPSGTYTVTIGAPGPPPTLTLSAGGNPPVCPYNCDHLYASASGGVPPYQYDFGMGYSSSTQSGCLTGNGGPVNYTVCVKDANNTIVCTTVTTYWPPPFYIFPSATSSQCGACNGSITLNGGSGSGMTYTIDGWAHSQTSPTFNNLCPGSYGICSISNSTCMATAGTLTVGQIPLTCTTSSTSATCNGGCNGSITVTPPGSVSSYHFSSDGGTTWQTSNIFPGLCAGTYTITTQNISSPGCTTTNTVTITQPPAIVPSVTITQPSCSGNCNGSFVTTVTPSGTYQYSINGGATYQSSATFSGLCAGNYTVTVKNAGNCTAAFSFTISQPSPVSISTASQTNILCSGGNNGAASVNASGGTGALTYNWTPGNPNGDGTNSVTNLTAGTWSCAVTDTHGCTANQTVNITQPSAITLSGFSQTNVLCNGGNNASAALNASGGTGTLTYDWSPGNPDGDGTDSIYNLAAGNYSCAVTDQNNCTSTQTFLVTQPPQITLTGTISGLACYGDCNASINLSATPADTYQFSIDNGATWQLATIFSGLCAGNYDVLAKNSVNCTATYSFIIAAPPQIVPAPTATQVTCYGNCNGIITTNVTPADTYQYSMDGGITWQNSNSFAGLCAGDYSVTVQNGNGCSITLTNVSVSEPSLLSSDITSQTNVTCFGNSNGTASVSASGGTGILSYDWTPGTPTGDGTNAVSGLAAGNYTCIVTDENNCTTTQTFAITQPSILYTVGSFSSCGVSCHGSCDGNISSVAYGGTPGYAFSYSAGPANLCAGNYSVTVTDTNGCVATTSVSLYDPPVLTVSTSVTADCNGNCSGSVIANVNGGTPIYSINYSPSPMPNNLCAGTYTVTVSDSRGCLASQAFTVSGGIQIDSVSSTGTPSFQSNGTAIVYPNGTAPFTYTWDAAAGNQTTQTASNLPAGNYCVTVTDANGCSDTACVNVPVITGFANGNDNNTFSIFPNPFTNEIFISGNGDAEISIYNATGQLVRDFGMQKLRSLPLTLNVQQDLAPGIYFMRVQTWSGTKIIRLVKE